MRAFGNLMNRIQEGPATVMPVVGMGATILSYSDRHAATIVAVKDGVISVQRDHAFRMDSNGMSDSQSYRYAPNVDAVVQLFSLRKDGSYVQLGSSMSSGQRVAIGYRDTYHDYSF